MALFLSTYVNKLDKKGRVSVPAQFRAAVQDQPFPGIVAYRSLQGPFIEASGIDRLTKFAEELETLDEGSERYALVTAILADARQLSWDENGRIVLPADLAAYAGLGEDAAFVGQGKFFLIRDPASQRDVVESVFAARAQAKAAKAGGA